MSTSIINNNKNPWIWQQQTSIESPLNSNLKIEIPRSIFWITPKNDPSPTVNIKEIEEPLLEINKYDKQAVKLIVIRRHKMRKHKLKKLRKKMKFEWAKVRLIFFPAEFVYSYKFSPNISEKTTPRNAQRKTISGPIAGANKRS